jgi:peroxiredoxin
LEDFRGKRVLLVHWSPLCGFCEQIAPDLALLQSDLLKRDTHLVLITQGGAEANRPLMETHGLNCPILLQSESELVEAFRMQGTPVAYLLDEEGRVAEPLALGSIDVLEVARAAARGKKRLGSERSLTESRIERDGLKAGTTAPGFRLPDLEGGTVSLEDYRGRRVLLVFSDPHCGPCDELIPELSRLNREDRDDGFALIMISRGDVEENRLKVQEHGVEFPVLLQHRWKVSMEYGILAMPVAYLVDGHGVISRDVARGPAEILALAQDQMAAKEVVPIE